MFTLNLATKPRLLSGASLIALTIAATLAVPARATTIGGITGRTAAQIAATAPTTATTSGTSSTSITQAASATSQSTRDLAAAVAAIKAQMSAQDAAHTAAKATASSVPNGIIAGGLNPDSGLATDGSANTVITWVNANTPTQTKNSDGSITVTIKQTDAKAIANWQSFNVGKDTTIHFDQTTGTATDGSNAWVILNRINDPSASPTQILGSIKAEGSVYILNHNGVIFGASAQVNTHSLVVSSLNLFSNDLATSNYDFLNHGIGDETWLGTVVSPPSGWSSYPNSVILTAADTSSGTVTVEQGATIAAQKNGLVLLAAPTLTNAGTISTTNGQVALIAGYGVQVSLTGSNSTDTRTFYNYNPFNDVVAPGLLLNSGLLESPTGNVSLLGGSIEQDGVIVATTSVSTPGTITISATYNSTDTPSGVNGFAQTELSGSVVFGPQSVTTILPDSGSASIPTSSAASVALGTINIEGASLDFKSGSLAYAPGQNINASVAYYYWGHSQQPDNVPPTSFWVDYPAGFGRIYVEDGATIDVSGMANVELSVASRLITVVLAGNELADSPLQKNGFLYGKTITVDADISGTSSDGANWVGTPLANLSGYTSLISQTIDQVLTNGGTVSLHGSEVDLAPGSTINLMGGYAHYLGGSIQTTKLIDASGRIVDISKADPNDTYVGIAGQTTDVSDRWGVSTTYNSAQINNGTTVPDYIVGGNAGALNINIDRSALYGILNESLVVPGAGALVLAGTIQGRAVSGVYQKASGKLTNGGKLSINTEFSVEITDSSLQASSLPYGFTADSPLLAILPGDSATVTTQYSPSTTPTDNPYANANVINDQVLNNAGLSNITISSSGAILVDAGSTLAVAPGGSISLSGLYETINGNLTARAGSISVTAVGGTPASSDVAIPYLAPTQYGVDANGNAVPEYLSNITVGSGAVLNASGLFVDDKGLAADAQSGPANINGGSISLLADGGPAPNNYPGYDTSGSVILSSGSLLDVSGGGRILPNGQLQTSNGVAAGSGGNVTLEIYAGGGGPAAYDGTVYPSGGPQYPTQGRLVLDCTIDALGFSGGGTITLGALGFQVGGDPNASRPDYALYFDPAQWGALGFASFNLMAGYDIVVPDGAKITLQHSNLIANLNTILDAPSGADLSDYTTVGVLDSSLRSATNLSLNASLEHWWGSSQANNIDYAGSATYAGLSANETSGYDLNGAIPLDTLVIGTGAEIVGDPKANISLVGDGYVAIYGTVRAPGGSISVTGSHNYDLPNGYDVLGATATTYLAPGSVLDVSGTTVLDAVTKPVLTSDGYVTPRTGNVIDGGTITLTDDITPLVVAAGATLNVSGASDTLDIVTSQGSGLSGATIVHQAAWSNGGNVVINASAALLFDGTLRGAAGNPQGTGATLTITQDSRSPNDTNIWWGFEGYSLTLVQNASAAGIGSSFVPADYQPGQLLPASETTGSEILYGVDSLNGSGFDSLVLKAPVIAYSGPVSLTLPKSFTALLGGYDASGNLDSGFFIALPTGNLDYRTATVPSTGNDGALSVEAAYIDFGEQSSITAPSNSTPVVSDGTLTLKANQIDLTSVFTLEGIGNATFISSGDIRLLPSDGNYTNTNGAYQIVTGALLTSGNLTFEAARIYPETDTTYIIEAVNPDPTVPTTVTFAYPDGVAGNTSAPLSANATLLVDATTINQNGNLHLPFGKIILGLNEITGGSSAETINTALGEDLVNLDYYPAGVVTQSVNLGSGSLTSVSGNGTVIPYGSTIDGNEWVYDPSSGTGSSVWTSPITAPPAKTISISGTSIAINSGATVDISGGGDLQASEWVPGTGGSRDVLSSSSVGTGQAVYAILPNYTGKTAAVDPYIDAGLNSSAAGTGSAIGEAVHISGVAGLADGVYTLLPAKYATLPGAYRVVINTKVTNPQPNQLGTEPDGTVAASGYLTNTLTGGRSSNSYEILVQSASVWEKYSEYTITSANTFFPSYAASQKYTTPLLPMDSGHLILGEISTTSMTLDGTVETSPATITSSSGTTTTGAGAMVDIVAQNIDIVDNVNANGPTTTVLDDGNTYILISATGLDGLNAGSLLIGGTRTQTTSGIEITPEANNVVVSNDKDAALKAPEILLTASPVLVSTFLQLDNLGDGAYLMLPQAGTGKVVLNSGSVVEATSSSVLGNARPEYFGSSLADLPVLPSSVTASTTKLGWTTFGPYKWHRWAKDGSLADYYSQVAAALGSLVQVSAGAPVTVTLPTVSQLNPGTITVTDNMYGTGSVTTALPSLASGSSIVVQSGAQLSATNALTLASAGDTRIVPDAALSGQTVQLDSSQITIAGTNAGTLPTTGAVIDASILSTLENASSLTFKSTGAIDFLGNVDLEMQKGTLALSAGSFVDDTGSTVTLAAPKVVLSNDLSAPVSTVAATGSSLAIKANEIDLDGGSVAFSGFDTVTMTASGGSANGIVGRDTGSFDFGNASVALNTPVLVAGTGSGQTLKTTGSFTLKGTEDTPLDTTADIGGAISLVGGSVVDSVPISAQSGNVAIEATAGDVALNTGTSIDVSAVKKVFYDKTEYTSAGAITLKADQGSVQVAANVPLDFSSTAAGGGNAGSLTVSAPNGSFNFDGTLAGAAASGYQGSSFSLDVASFAVGGASGFDALAAVLTNAGVNDTVTVHTRSGDLALTKTLTASQVSLTADGGFVDISGTIDASGKGGGEIDLYGAKGVTLSGSLLAKGSDPNQRGGTVNIGTTGTWDGTLNADGSEHLTSSGTINLMAGSLIDVSGGTYAGLSGGTVSLRAPIINGTVDVTVATNATIKGARDVVLEAYKTWNTTAGSGFDGIIDPEGWFSSNGTLVANGTFTTYDSNSNVIPVASWENGVLTNEDGTTNSLSYYLTNDVFTPDSTGINTAHTTFYNTTLVGFVQNPGIDDSRFSGIANFHLRPGVELVNNDHNVNNGNISVLSDWDLGQGTGSYDPVTGTYSSYTGIYRVAATGEPGILTLRAVNNVVFDSASISDGFYAFNKVGSSGYYAAYAAYQIELQEYEIALQNYTTIAANYPSILAQYDGATNYQTAANNYSSMLAQYGGATDYATATSNYTQGLAVYWGATTYSDAVTYYGYCPDCFSGPPAAWLATPPLTPPPPPTAPQAPVAPNYQAYQSLVEQGPNSLIQESQMPASWGDSWSYRVVAGSDTTSANPLSVKPVSSFSDTSGSQGSVVMTGHRTYTYTVEVTSNSYLTDTTYFDYSLPNSSTSLTYSQVVSEPATFVEPSILRTGTGSIDVAAAVDVALTDPNNPDPLGTAVIYTAGKPVEGAPQGSPYTRVAASGILYAANYNDTGLSTLLTGVTNADGGGDITIVAGKDVIGTEAAYDTVATYQASLGNGDLGLSGNQGAYIGQFWVPWLLEQPDDPSQSWYVNFGSFQQGVMSLGGNVTVKAAHDIKDFSVSLPTSAYVTGSGNSKNLVRIGGGKLTVEAGNDIDSGSYYVGHGTGTITAGGKIASDFTYISVTDPNSAYAVATLLAVQDAQISVSARQSADIGGIYDPTYLYQNGIDPNAFAMPVADWSYLGNGVALVPYYASMTPASAVDIRATAGSIDFNSLQAQGNLFAYGMQHNRTNYSVSYANTTTSILLPASLSLVAFDGSIDIGHGGGLYPSLDGDLTLIADGDITLASIVKSSDGSTWIGNIDSRVLELLSYPADSGILPTPLAPQTVYYDNESTQYVATSPTANSINDPSLLAASDTVRIYSLNGGISDGIELSDGTATAELAIVSNRPAQIYAAGDITDLSFYGQNLSDTDITAIIAGGDIVYHPISTAVTQVQYYSLTALAPEIDISGPGMLDVEAGGDIIFPSQRAKSGIETGIRTLGNSLDTGTAIGTFGNPYLEQGGASVNVLFGVGKGVDYASFISTYVDPTDGSAILADEPLLLTGFVEKYAKKSNLTADQAWILFQALPAAQQHLFVEQVFFDVLNETGLDYNNPASTYYHKYDRGYQAINTLFPSGLGYTANNLTGGTNGANAFVHTGNLDLRGSTIQTQQGGDISLVGPGGTILVGTQLAAPSFITPQMEGIITIENGNIRTFTDTSVEVAQSRVMTEQGGDILMWSSNGDLDAGKGAKTSFAFPPPVYSCDNDWYCVVDTKGLVTGAGIASLQTLPDSSIGNANLIAPRGTVDAGAAGIRVSGNLNIAALYVANTFNIEVNGTTIGVPTLTTNLNLATVSNASTEAATILDNLKAKEPQNTIDVEVTGFGGDVNQPVECVPNSVHPCKR